MWQYSFSFLNSFTYLLQIKGKWYPILLACDQRKKIEENGSMRVFVEYIDVLANSSLQFTLHTFL
jgi:hypothetical protein